MKVMTPKKSLFTLDVEQGEVINIFSSSRDTYCPSTIVFKENGQIYQLHGAKLLRKVCKAYKDKSDSSKIIFSAKLTIEDKTIIKVE